MLCTVIKKKLVVFTWQGFGFTVKREVSLSESPRLVINTESFIIVGQKKSYEAIDTTQFTSSKVLDFDKEHKMVALNVRITVVRIVKFLRDI
jgi:hypothetical protein